MTRYLTHHDRSTSKVYTECFHFDDHRGADAIDLRPPHASRYIAIKPFSKRPLANTRKAGKGLSRINTRPTKGQVAKCVSNTNACGPSPHPSQNLLVLYVVLEFAGLVRMFSAAIAGHICATIFPLLMTYSVMHMLIPSL